MLRRFFLSIAVILMMGSRICAYMELIKLKLSLEH